MYSPKIKEELISTLYRIAKDQGVPMTRLVNDMLEREVKKIERSKCHEHDLSQSN